MRHFPAFFPPTAPSLQKVVSVLILVTLLGFVLTGIENPWHAQIELAGPQQAAETKDYLDYDQLVQKFVDGTYATKDSAGGAFHEAHPPGNVGMVFANFDTKDPKVQGLMQKFYYRAAYVAFPRRVLVANADTIIPQQPLYTEPPIPLAREPDDGDSFVIENNIKRVVTVVPGGFRIKEYPSPNKP